MKNLKREQQKKNHVIRWSHRLAEYIGNAVKELDPEEIELMN